MVLNQRTGPSTATRAGKYASDKARSSSDGESTPMPSSEQQPTAAADASHASAPSSSSSSSHSSPPSFGQRLFEYVMTEHRSLVVVVLALPLSLLWDVALSLRLWVLTWWLRGGCSGGFDGGVGVGSRFRRWLGCTAAPPASSAAATSMSSAARAHARRVQDIVASVKARPAGKQLCTGRPGWQSMSLSYRNYKTSEAFHAVEMPLLDVVALNLEGEVPTVVVEPFVTMGQLSAVLLPLGFTLPVVPEMDDLTVGGLVNGTGVESSSHRCGLFHEQCLAFEVCLADGSVVVATASNAHADLFHAIPWSYGTLGLLLSVKLRVVKSKPFVKLTYVAFKGDRQAALEHFQSLSCRGVVDTTPPAAAAASAAKQTSEQASKQTSEQTSEQASAAAPVDFVEALAFSLDDFVVMAGELVEAAEAYSGSGETSNAIKVNSIGRWFKPWFYKHVESMLSLPPPHEEFHKESTGNNNNEKKEGREEGAAAAKTVSTARTAATFVEFVPLRDYYHRHSRSMFWEMGLMLPIGNHPLARCLLGWLLPPKVSFLKMTQTELTRKLTQETHVAQDFLVPLAKLEDVLSLCDKAFDRVYPVWLCPHLHRALPGSILVDPPNPTTTTARSSSSSSSGLDLSPSLPPSLPQAEMYVDVGVYGLPRGVLEQHEQQGGNNAARSTKRHGGFDMRGAMRCVEKELRAMSGVQMLYADIFHSKAEFEAMFPHDGYRQVRRKYRADEAFPEVFGKMHSLY